jgi:hypothetical protein
MRYYRYDKNTGKILAQCFRRIADDPGLPPDSETVGNIEVDEYGHHYVDITVSPPILLDQEYLNASWDKTTVIANSGDFATLSPIPLNTLFSINGFEVEVNDGALEVYADLVGEYKVKIISPKFVSQYWIITGV